jgi:hypothetical protein
MAKSAKTKKYTEGISGKKPLRVCITNAYSGNDYSATVLLGSEKVPVNVLLDTGSSTFAVSPSAYNALNDKLVKPTTYAQVVQYGTGGWAGPLVNTLMTIGHEKESISLNRSHIAITTVQEKNNFVGIHGILGLAYNGLNVAYDLKNALPKKGPQFSHPWPFKSKDFDSFNKKFQELMGANDIPQKGVVPYFTELEEEGVVANKFAFYTLRSRTQHITKDKSKALSDPMNNGFFIIGGGEEQTDLYEGGMDAFLTAEVYHHLYYNTNLKTVQVAGCDPIEARPLQKKYIKASISNSIIDTGTNRLCLANDVYKYIMKSFKKINPEFAELIRQSDEQDLGLEQKKLNLAEWPAIHFTFSGDGRKDITLTCTPDTYWQINTPNNSRAVFQIAGPEDVENQSVFGLPLFNNYYTIFDRSVHKHGVIRFAPIKRLK